MQPGESPVEPSADDSPVCRVAGPFKDAIDATRHVVKARRAGLDVETQATGKPN
jgi:hypothetical protein